MNILRKKRRKLFWPAGLMVLAIVSLIFFMHVATDPGFREKRTMEIRIPPFGEDFKWIKEIEPSFNFPNENNWIKYEFTENESHNSLLFTLLRKEIRQFKTQPDTMQGIHIVLSRGMSYDRFVKILDMLNIENVKRYLYGNNILIHKYPRLSPYGLSVWLDDLRVSYQYSWMDSFICLETVGYNPTPLSWRQRIIESFNQCYLYFQNALMQLPLLFIISWCAVFIFNIFKIIKY